MAMRVPHFITTTNALNAKMYTEMYSLRYYFIIMFTYFHIFEELSYYYVKCICIIESPPITDTRECSIL